MGSGVTYSVSTVYNVKNNASQPLREISQAARDTAQSTGTLSDQFKTLTAMAGAYFGFGKAKALLVDYNSELEQSQTIIAGMLSLYTGAHIEKSWSRASVSVERFQQMAAKSALTTKELVETAQGLTRPLIQVGVKMTDIEKITFGVANAAKAFSMNGAVVAMDIEQAIRGGVTERDRFAKSMLAQKEIGLTHTQFNAKSQQERIQILQKALTSKAISDMADKQSGTMKGVFSTMEDNIQIAFGRVGLPLVAAITKQVKEWNTWLEANGSKVEEIGRSFSSAIMYGVKTMKQVVSEMWPFVQSFASAIKDLISFASNHRETLLALAKALVVMKIGEKIGGLAKAGAGSIGGLFSPFGESFSKIKEGMEGLKNGTGALTAAFSNMGAILGGAGGLLGAFSKLAVLAYTLGGFMFRETQEEKERKARAQGQILAASQYSQARHEVETSQKFYDDLGFNPQMNQFTNSFQSAEYERLQKLKADMAATEANLIAEGKKFGMVLEEITSEGERKMTLLSGPSSNLMKTTIPGYDALTSQLTQLFKDKSLQAAREYGQIMRSGWDFSAGQMFGAGSGVMGFYKEKVFVRKPTDPDEEFQTKPWKQEVTINIQRVMAKDPNRWLAEMDDMVARKNRAPTRARESWRSSPR